MMLKTKFLLYILAIIVSSLLYACSERNQPNEILLEKDLEIGVEDGDERFVFSRIPSIALDAQEHIYILDRMNYRILKFDTNGDFLSSIYIEKGEGPGEISMITSMAVTQKSKIFIFDRFARKVLAYSEIGELLNSFQVGFYSTYILPSESEDVILLGLNEDHIFHIFSATGELLESFGGPFDIPRKYAQHSRLAHLKIPLRADISIEGRMFLVSPHEYKIRIFKSRELVDTLVHTSEEFSPLELRVHDKESATVGMTFPWLTVHEHKKRLYVTLKKFGDDTPHTLHVFENKNCIASLQVNGYALAIDKMGRLYFSEEEDYPKMIRYSVIEQ